MENFSMNWLAVIVSALVPLIIGAFWYHTKVFGSAWMKATGITEEKIKQASPLKAYIIALIMSVVLSFYLYINVLVGGPDEMRHGTEAFMTFRHGFVHGAFLAVFVVLPTMATNSFFEMKSTKYIFINVFYWVVSLAFMGGILNGWPV
ncbi:DUF1761 domain-containing protein [Flavobacteriaceae bacterium]|nr:DUF1761 domain-containing protein [Flavobacteriaceae bacterium]